MVVVEKPTEGKWSAYLHAQVYAVGAGSVHKYSGLCLYEQSNFFKK